LSTVSDFRTPGSHDCDRILYSTAFRRLAGVTQVVAIGERQLFHNRLTHSQKVAQLGRRIAQFINWDERSAEGRKLLNGGEVDVDVAEAAGLAHDMGHPPFGHISEVVLNPRCWDAGADGYEGNAQSLRIVTKLAWRRSGQGLDLSPRTLNAILKYPWMSDHQRARDGHGKWGAYQTERAAFLSARQGDESTNQSVEAAIMDWADDISYAVHDLEDFYRAGFIRLERLKDNKVEREEFVALASEELKTNLDWDSATALDTFNELFEFVALTYKSSGTIAHRQAVSRMGSFFINRYVEASVLDDQGNLSIDISLRREVMLLKQLTWQFVIQDATLTTLQTGQQLVVGQLFDDLHGWIKSETKLQRLPTRLYELDRESRKEEYSSDEARRARTVADYVSSLTEDQTVDLHARLRGQSKGSVHDSWVNF
jgi:dGTPase